MQNAGCSSLFDDLDGPAPVAKKRLTVRLGAADANVSSFLQELDRSIAEGSDRSLLRALWHATDVLIEEIWTFGEVIGLLARELEEASRAKLARSGLRMLRTMPLSRPGTRATSPMPRRVQLHRMRPDPAALTRSCVGFTFLSPTGKQGNTH